MSALHPELRKTLIFEVCQALPPLSGESWEPIGHVIAETLAGVPLLHRGQSIKGNSQGNAVDSFSETGDVAAQYGTEAGYFSSGPKTPRTGSRGKTSGGRNRWAPGLKKPKEDYEHVRALLPQVKRIFLLSTQQATADELTEVTNWCDAARAADGVDVRVYDARQIAEYIVDVLFEHEAIAEELARHLPPIRRALELHVATNTIPLTKSDTIVRPDVEDAIVAALDAYHIVLVSGLSGMGKTEIAISVANRLKSDYAWPVWSAELRVADVADLAAADIDRGGMRVNLRSTLATRSCLVVLDDLHPQGRLGDLMDRLRAALGDDARLIVTSQQVEDRPYTVTVGPMGEGDARLLLSQGVAAVPDDAFRAIWERVGGHPMALRLLNGLARDGEDWPSVARRAESIGTLEVVERAAYVVDLVLASRRRILEGPLGAFLWANARRIHREILELVSPGGERTLRRLGLVTVDQPDTVRLHDIVWTSLKAFDPPLTFDGPALEEKLHTYVAGLARSEARTMVVNHLARVHESLLRRLVTSDRWRPGHLYAWLHAPREARMSVAVLPSALEMAREAARSGDSFNAQVSAELAEDAVVRAKSLRAESIDEGALLAPFDVLLQASGVPSAEKVFVRHHKAKALKRLGRHRDAVTELDSVVDALGIDHTPAVARLLLARTLTELPDGVEIPDAGHRARTLLIALLDEALAGSDEVSSSVTLAAAELLRRRVAGINVKKAVGRYAGLLAPLIVDATRRGLMQGPLAFGALANAWKDVDKDQFWAIFDAMPLPSAPGELDIEVEEQDAMVAWGEALVAAAELDDPRRQTLLEAALDFFAVSSRPYARRHAARALTRLGRAGEAVELMQELTQEDERPLDRAWTLRRLAEAHEALGDIQSARELARRALDTLPAGYVGDFDEFLKRL